MPDLEIVPATDADAPELLVLTRACWVQEALANETLDIPALHESLDQVRSDIERWDTYVVRAGTRLVASVRGRLTEGEDGRPVWDIGRLMVAPDLQGSGLGRRLLDHIQSVAPAEAVGFELFTGERSTRNHRMYLAAGFVLRPEVPAPPSAVMLTKAR
ncbi:GNAT family N-acetyltransferase [Planctomonas sp. JC2975]|uniref:GNAT family N-acetyltransferase n=1 Tax=Planctomonas sp. JC2975 TaxID=2729626 RepID=UPI00197CA32E